MADFIFKIQGGMYTVIAVATHQVWSRA